MGRFRSFFLFLSLVLLLFAGHAFGEGNVLVLPLRSVGVSDTTITVSRDLLVGELASGGMQVIGIRSLGRDLPSGAEACDEAECARSLATDLDAGLVIYGSLSKLGEKVITQIHALRIEDAEPFYNEQLAATSEEDLDRVMRRFAEGITGGRPNSADATVESVIQEESRAPRLRATRRGLGVRAGFLFPDGKSYGEADRLTSLRFVYKHESPTYFVETTTIAGLTWSGGTVEWDIFDLFVGKIVGAGDEGFYLGGGLGVHSLHVEGPERKSSQDDIYYYPDKPEESATTLTLDLGGGILGLRTYDFQVVLDLRYHYVFDDFNKVNDKGAHGFFLTFGTNR